MLAPSQIVQRVLRWKTELAPEPVRDQPIEPRALIHFVEMRQSLPRKKDVTFPGSHWRTVHVIQQPFHEITGRSEVLQPLLVLNSYRRAPKLVRDAHRGNVQLALLKRLILREFGSFISSELKTHPSVNKPIQHLTSFGFRDLLHRSKQAGLAQPFFEHSRRMQQFVRNDGVEHPHPSLVENPQDGFTLLQLAREFSADIFISRRDLQRRKLADMALIVSNHALA